MASGFGFNGGRSRCFTFWQEFQKCYANADVPSECVGQKDDYIECLHHTKEIARAKHLREHYLARQAKEAKEARTAGERRATGGIMRLGIIGQEGNGQESSSEKSGKGDSKSESDSKPKGDSKSDGKGDSKSDSKSDSGSEKGQSKQDAKGKQEA